MATFPTGFRVLVVDDDFNCLSTLQQLLQACHYQVMACQRAIDALGMLRGGVYEFDIVLTEVYMTQMDGFQFMEIIRQEMDHLPVVMMSRDCRRETVVKGVKMGASGFLLKPICKQELTVLWQHIVRKQNDMHSLMLLMSRLDNQISGGGDGDNANESIEENCHSSIREVDGEIQKNDINNIHNTSLNMTTLKKQRMIWTHELHQHFVAAVNHVGLENAVPKKILELMNVEGLTREKVASHLQLRPLKEIGNLTWYQSRRYLLGSNLALLSPIIKYRINVERKKQEKKLMKVDEAHPHPHPDGVSQHTHIFSSSPSPSSSIVVGGGGGNQAINGGSPFIYHGNYNNNIHQHYISSETTSTSTTFEAYRQNYQRIEGVPTISSFNQYNTTNQYYAFPTAACTTMTGGEQPTHQNHHHHETLHGKYINFSSFPSSNGSHGYRHFW